MSEQKPSERFKEDLVNLHQTRVELHADDEDLGVALNIIRTQEHAEGGELSFLDKDGSNWKISLADLYRLKRELKIRLFRSANEAVWQWDEISCVLRDKVATLFIEGLRMSHEQSYLDEIKAMAMETTDYLYPEDVNNDELVRKALEAWVQDSLAILERNFESEEKTNN